MAAALTAYGYRVTGVDPSAAMLARARRLLGPEAVLLQRTLPELGVDGVFDAVISTEGIEHLENHFLFLSEAHRILKRDSVLVLTTPNITALRSRVRFFGSGFFGRDGRPPNETRRHPLHHISLATFSELRYELHVSGFRIGEARHTHIKPISFLYSVDIPWIWLYTLIAFRKEKDPVQRNRNKEIRAALHSFSLLFGECLMLTARKEPGETLEKQIVEKR